MLLDQIVLHNFGLYRGRHVIVLTTKPNKPIVLFGALNGSGKTTLLDALQLVLYGKMAQCSNRRELAYEEFLRRCVHRDAEPQNAAIELQFRQRISGVEHTYRVHRSWVAQERTVREKVEVLRDGRLDPVLTESWLEFIEELLPVRLSKFFFFDGEQIEALADLESSADVLATSIQSLLGLDLVEQLVTDLKVVERRNRDKQKPAQEQAELATAELQVKEIEARFAESQMQCAGQQNKLDRLREQVRRLETKFKREGGEIFGKRVELQEQRVNVSARLKETEEKLRQLAAGPAPLLLVDDLLAELAATASHKSGLDLDALDQLLQDRDALVVKVVKAAGADKRLTSAIREHLRHDRAMRVDRANQQSGLQLSQQVLSDIRALHSGGGLAKEAANAKLLVSQLEDLQRELARLDRLIETLPAPGALEELTKKLEETRQELSRAEGALVMLQEQTRALEQERDRKWKTFAKRADADVEERFKQKEASRIIEYAESVRVALGRFKDEAARRHVRRIEDLITSGLEHLLRKDDLVSKVQINPVTYRMTLLGRNGTELSPDRLSAGERQLLAVATIWGLARAAGRPLPVVIDTPLGRLDSIHRSYLVERYFPTASHQVLLLSTDEEIDSVQFNKLKPHLARTYLLTYNQQQSSTVVQPGYFPECQ